MGIESRCVQFLLSSEKTLKSMEPNESISIFHEEYLRHSFVPKLGDLDVNPSKSREERARE